MPMCLRCKQEVLVEGPFCKSCGNARVASSLLEFPGYPPWYRKAFKLCAGLVGLWFLITIGIAFLREAKALRRAQTALEANKPDEAYEWVYPFVEANMDNSKALFIASISAIRTARPAEAGIYYSRLSAMESEGAVEWKEMAESIFVEQIPKNAAVIRCGQSNYEAFHEAYLPLGERFHDALMNAAAVVARTCVWTEQARLANEPSFWLIQEKGMDPEVVVNALYIEPLTPALVEADYKSVRLLGQQALMQLPEVKDRLDSLLHSVRADVTASFETFREVCKELSRSPEYRERRGGYPCFPTSAPEITKVGSEAMPIVYSPLAENRGCRGGFALSSEFLPSSVKAMTFATSGKSELSLSCRYERGRLSFRKPDSFWFLQD